MGVLGPQLRKLPIMSRSILSVVFGDLTIFDNLFSPLKGSFNIERNCEVCTNSVLMIPFIFFKINMIFT